MSNLRDLTQVGLDALERGDPDSAVLAFRKVLKKSPRDIELLHLAAYASIRSDRTTSARKFLAKALKLDPNHSDSNNTLGVLYLGEGRVGQATKAFETAIRSNPRNHRALRNLAKLLRDQDQLTKSLDVYQQLGELEPEDAGLQNLIGTLLMNHGDFDKAIVHLRRSVTLSPAHGGSWIMLAEMDKDISDEDIVVMQKVLAAQLETPLEGDQIAYALFRTFEQRGDTEKAGEYLVLANQRRRQCYQYDVSTDEDYMAEISKVLTASFIKTETPAPLGKQQPIFVLGLPRSGTTLIEQILSHHHLIGGAGERGSIDISLTKMADPRNRRYPDGLPFWKEKDFAFISKSILEILAETVPAAPYVIDKTPQNFLYIGLIKRLWPDALIIYCKRNLMDCAWSNFKTPFREGNYHTSSQEELIRYFEASEKLMDHWRKTCPGGFLELAYEEMTADQEGQTRRLLDYCGVPWDPDCLDFHKNKRAVRTASSVQIRSPVYTTSLRAWEPYANILQPLAAAFAGRNS
ncbi:MAG: tetratricopeptide repeat protein [Alphaproteobacteria bacterium]|nr:tetratricopeptide repeat protein [Alphaproteobacteria bacterium]MBT4084996.1 tetratricopeptide repeat protein [Alphaproteobacteria bacterium]MBT7744572.1 tetratricopeptide repeat protein [Alphaproteobacteria bacterium]